MISMLLSAYDLSLIYLNKMISNDKLNNPKPDFSLVWEFVCSIDKLNTVPLTCYFYIDI